MPLPLSPMVEVPLVLFSWHKICKKDIMKKQREKKNLGFNAADWKRPLRRSSPEHESPWQMTFGCVQNPDAMIGKETE
jgi:hypothetical protein